MGYRVLADFVVLVHLAFILFAVLGGVLVLWRKRCAWIHVPAVLWAALVEFMDWVCPLTPLESWLREQGGGSGYRTSFVAHHLLPIIYPASLPRPWQVALGVFVLAINLGIYAWVLLRATKAKT